MANWRSFGDRMLHCRRSTLKTWCNCSNLAAGFYRSTCGVGRGDGLLSPVQSPEYFLPLGGRSVGVFKKGATFSLIQRCFSSGVVVDEEEARGGISTTLVGPLPLGSAPCLMLPAGYGLVAQGEGEGESERFKLVTLMEDDERDYYRFFSIRENKVVKMRKNNHRLLLPWQREALPPDEAICFGSSRGWVAFIHPRNSSLYLFNPFVHSYLPYLPLPPIHTLPCIISCARHNPNINHTSSSSSSSIVTEFTIWSQFSPISSQDLNKKEAFFKKIVLSSAPSPFPSNHHHHEHINNTNTSNEKIKYSSECTVMVIQGYKKNKLAFCRIGDTAWTALNGAEESYKDVKHFNPHTTQAYTDLFYFSKDQTFYALSVDYSFIEAWDLRNPASPKNTIIISHLPPLEHPTMDKHQRLLRTTRSDSDRYLVESLGELLMVVRYYDYGYYDTIAFDVYKLDFANKEWLLLQSLGHRAIFIGLNDSVSVSAHDFPGLTHNCIYFTRPHAKFLGVFNLEDNTITPIYHHEFNVQKPSLWVVPDLSNEEN